MPSATKKSKMEVTEAINHSNKVKEEVGRLIDYNLQVKAKKVSEKSKPSMKAKEVRDNLIHSGTT